MSTGAGTKIVTLSEGEVTELHVGLKGTMNQLFLKDLAAKTGRGLRGRVEAGRSGRGNAYGYDVVRRLASDGSPVTGERQINEIEAATVQRIFLDFADGRSPKAIARQLNAESIKGPRGLLWRDTAIRGHRQRGTGILNNELYVGRLVWNRLRYLKDPSTGKRVSRLNPPDEWVVKDVPDLQIIDETLWDRVKARQGEIDAEPRVLAVRRSRFWEKKRKIHLLTGLLRCGSCGGGYAAVGSDYVASSNARKLGTCEQRKSFKRINLDSAVLDILRHRLMEPDATAAFVAAFSAEMNKRNGASEAQRHRLASERATLARKVDGLYDAISEGLRTPGLRDKLREMEGKLGEIDAALAAPAPTPVRLNPNLSELYRRKVAELSETLKNPDHRQRALEVIRGLIQQATVRVEDERAVLEIDGALTAMIMRGSAFEEAHGRSLSERQSRSAEGAKRRRSEFGRSGCGGRI